MRWVFWGAAAMSVTHIWVIRHGCGFRSRWHLRPIRAVPHLASVSIAMVVHNEADSTGE